VKSGWASAASRPDERGATGAAPDGDDLPELRPLAHMTVAQNVAYGLRFKSGVSKADREPASRRNGLRIVQLAASSLAIPGAFGGISNSESPWRGPPSRPGLET